MIAVIVHDPDPDPIAPITEADIHDALDALGYHVRAVLVRNDFPPPCWLINRELDKHVGPFSTRCDAVIAADLAWPDRRDDGFPVWEVLADEEFHIYLDVRQQARLNVGVEE